LFVHIFCITYHEYIIMDRLPAQQQQDVRKASTDRLRSYLIKAGYDEDTVLAYDRNALMDAFAEYLLSPPPVEPQGATAGADLQQQTDQTDKTDETEETKEVEDENTVENQAGETELDFTRRELALREQEIKLREKETERQKEKDKKDQELPLKELELREKELERQKEKDEEEKKRKESLAGQTRFD